MRVCNSDGSAAMMAMAMIAMWRYWNMVCGGECNSAISWRVTALAGVFGAIGAGAKLLRTGADQKDQLLHSDCTTLLQKAKAMPETPANLPAEGLSLVHGREDI